MNPRHAFLALVAVLVGASANVHAQVYKWVDQNGVTNYAAKPPTQTNSVKKLDVVAERLSVYAPDKAVLRALSSASSRNDPTLSNRIDWLERQLAAERLARQYAAAGEAGAMQAAYEQCLSQRRVDCDSLNGYYPYAPFAVAVTRHRNRQQPFFPNNSLSGVTAGNVTAAIRSAGGQVDDTPGAMGSGISGFGPSSAARAGRALRGR